MCTGLYYNQLMGRNYDYEKSYNETLTITPRKYPLKYKNNQINNNHYAIIGITPNISDYPLYYDAVNEEGLCICGLNFKGNAEYNEPVKDKVNLTSFELLPYILAKYCSINELLNDLPYFNITNENYSEELMNTPLHWLIGDKYGDCIVVEQTYKGLDFYFNSYGVLTNNPTFPLQVHNLRNYRMVTNKPIYHSYSRGMGSIGLNGDLTSMGRFVRCYWTRKYCKDYDNYWSNINQFYHILASVVQVDGCTIVNDEGDCEYTIYTDCYDLNNPTLYYKQYGDFGLNEFILNDYDLENDKLILEEL